LIEKRVDLDDLKRAEAAVLGDHFEGEMSFAIGCSAPDKGARAGSKPGIDHIYVKGHRITPRGL
jgi:hypothetical protein